MLFRSFLATKLAFTKARWTRRLILLFCDGLAVLPSVVVGMMGVMAIALARHKGVSVQPGLLTSALFVGLMSLPFCTLGLASILADEEHQSLDELGQSLSLKIRQRFLSIHLPLAKGGFFSLSLVAFARVCQDTAVVMLTGASIGVPLPSSIFDPFETLSVRIYFLITEVATREAIAEAHMGALALVAFIAALRHFGQISKPVV